MKNAAIALTAIATAALIARPIRVEGDSMLPTYQAGDWLLTLPLWGTLEQGDVVVFTPPPAAASLAGAQGSALPIDPNQAMLKRVVGLPGQAQTQQHVPETELAGNGTAGDPAISPATHTDVWGLVSPPAVGLAVDHYFLIGDNPSSSIDSRQFGSVPRSNIKRRVVGRIWSKSP